MKTLVTGATGFVGSAVLRRLVDAGHEVRVLRRPSSDNRNLLGVECETVVGDLTDPASLTAAVAGCAAVYHVAADYRLWTEDHTAIYRANVDGTLNLMRAAGDAGVGRIVYTSSVAAVGFRDDGAPADETTVTTLKDMVGHYKRSKYLAEQEVLRLATGEGLPIVTVNPSAPFGPRDVKPTPTGRIIVQFARGRMPAYVDTGLNVVHVDDVARGHLLAFERGAVGERYILGGDDMPLRLILETVAERLGRKPPRFRLPRAPLMPVAWMAEAMARLTGKEPMVTADALRMARKRMYFSSTKAREKLGYAPRPGTEALCEAVDWFRSNGYFG